MKNAAVLITVIAVFPSFALAENGIDKLQKIERVRQRDIEYFKSNKLESSPPVTAAISNVCQVVSRIPAPGETEGLAMDGSSLWASIDPYPYQKQIFKISSTNGGIYSSFLSPGEGPKGLALVGTSLWNVDFLDDHIYQLNKSGSIVGGVDIHPPGSNQYTMMLNSGIAWDGAGFWVTDWYSDYIYKISAVDGTSIDSFLSPLVTEPYGLAWDGTDLWISYSEGIYKIDPTTGNILIACTDSDFRYGQAYGLTWDGTYLWGGSWISDEIIKISVPPPRIPSPPPPPTDQKNFPAINFLLLGRE